MTASYQISLMEVASLMCGESFVPDKTVEDIARRVLVDAGKPTGGDKARVYAVELLWQDYPQACEAVQKAAGKVLYQTPEAPQSQASLAKRGRFMNALGAVAAPLLTNEGDKLFSEIRVPDAVSVLLHPSTANYLGYEKMSTIVGRTLAIQGASWGKGYYPSTDNERVEQGREHIANMLRTQHPDFVAQLEAMVAKRGASSFSFWQKGMSLPDIREFDAKLATEMKADMFKQWGKDTLALDLGAPSLTQPLTPTARAEHQPPAPAHDFRVSGAEALDRQPVRTAESKDRAE